MRAFKKASEVIRHGHSEGNVFSLSFSVQKGQKRLHSSKYPDNVRKKVHLTEALRNFRVDRKSSRKPQLW